MENNGEISTRTPPLLQLPGQLSKIPDISRLPFPTGFFQPRKLEIFPNCGKQVHFPSPRALWPVCSSTSSRNVPWGKNLTVRPRPRHRRVSQNISSETDTQNDIK